jgi:UDP:flavonoid glycosyltransferase YjiC (YdhE family)
MDHVVTDKNGGKTLPHIGQPRVLVAPLDWGLGHATRCIPVIHELLAQGAEPWLAGEKAQEQLLRSEFPQLQFLHLAGYRIRYSKTSAGLIWKMIRQVPKMRNAIQYENEWLKKMIAKYRFAAVISDNRYGLYNEKIPCVFITHQLQIKSAAGKWTEALLQKSNYRYIERFSTCWVPDESGEPNLGAALSHPKQMPRVPVKYCGVLTRMNKTEAVEEKGHLLIILSGPEPQRTLLENKIVEEISEYPGTVTVVRGLPGGAHLIPSTNGINFYNHLPAMELNKEMERAEWVISRSGYSTVMDAVYLRKKCIFIPTPGQTEQEYLSESLLMKKVAYSTKQKNFSLRKALQAANNFQYELPRLEKHDRLKELVGSLLHQSAIPALG